MYNPQFPIQQGMSRAQMGQQMPTFNPMAVPVGMRNTIFNQMYNTNPQFREFANSLSGMSPQQGFAKYGLDSAQYLR